LAKFCPILLASPLMSMSGDCTEEKCAWWDSCEDQCAIKLLGVGAMYQIRKDES